MQLLLSAFKQRTKNIHYQTHTNCLPLEHCQYDTKLEKPNVPFVHSSPLSLFSNLTEFFLPTQAFPAYQKCL